jgi:EmrB/QacA subfamily drug resistance transporter
MTVAARPHMLRQRLFTEPRRPERIRTRPSAYWLVVGTVCVGAGMGQLDASIVSLALPTLQRHFHASLGQVEWVALGYLLVLVATVPAVGRLSDMVGRKLLYTYGFAVFSGASVACGLAPNLPLLDVFRAVQALGAAMLQANSVALIATTMPREKLSRAIGVQGAAQAIGLALGPTIGGALIALGGWRLIFLVNAPVGVLGLALGWFLLPRSRELAPRVRFDWVGLALFAPAVAALLAALSLSRAGLGAGYLLGLAGIAIACAVAFVGWERRAAAPMIDLGLFRRVSFAAGVGAGLLAFLVLFGVLFVTPFLLERAHHVGSLQAGLQLTLLPLGVGLTAPAAGRLADRIGPRVPTVVGMLVATAGSLMAALGHQSSAVVLVALAVIGIGLGAFIPANNAAIMASAPRQQAGVAGGVLNMTRGLGTALGVAVTGLVFGLVGGHPAGTASAGGGFATALLMLAALAATAGGVVGLRRFRGTRRPA